MMPLGLSTEVGERGTTLSGGQQARVCVARAVYAWGLTPAVPSLLLADDCLSAVDPEVASHIFRGLRAAVAGGGGGACVMAINQLHLLPKFDHIVYLVGGRVAEQGTFEHKPGLPPEPAPQ